MAFVPITQLSRFHGLMLIGTSQKKKKKSNPEKINTFQKNSHLFPFCTIVLLFYKSSVVKYLEIKLKKNKKHLFIRM